MAARLLARGKQTRIAVCVPKQIAYFYDELWAGIRDEAARYSGRGVEFVFVAVPALGKGERAAFRELLEANPGGIIVTPGNPDAMTPLIDAAEQRGTRVVCVSTDAPMSQRSSVVYVEPRLSGLIAGELMANFVPPGSRVAIITGMLKTMDHREKVAGFVESFRERSREGKVASAIEAHEHANESFHKTKLLLQQEPHLAGIYVNTVNCLPVCRALAAAGRTGQVRVIATDLFQQMIPLIKSGAIAASIHQQPYVQGQLSVRCLVDHLLHHSELAAKQFLNPSIILRSNLHLFPEVTARRA